LDSQRFHRRIFRVQLDDVSDVAPALELLGRERAEMVIARCPVEKLAIAQAIERRGFLLMDTLVHYDGETARFVEPPAVDPPVEIRPFAAGDLAPLQAVAAAAFAEFGGHYHADDRLDASAATAGYVEWFTRATTDPAMLVLVAAVERRAVGFLTL